jgi:hypothetical protein
MSTRPDPATLEIKPASPQEAASIEHYSRIAGLLLEAEVRTQVANHVSTGLSLGQSPAYLRAVRTDDRPFDDLPGRNPFSAFANLASMFTGLSRPPLAMNYQWGDEASPGRHGEIRIKNEGMAPEQFDRERNRIEALQWDIAQLVRTHIGPDKLFDPYSGAGRMDDSSVRQDFTRQLQNIISYTQMSAAREQLQNPAGVATLAHWAAQPAQGETLVSQGIEQMAHKAQTLLQDISNPTAAVVPQAAPERAAPRSRPPSAAAQP